MDDWRRPKARAKSALKDMVFQGMSLSGRLRLETEVEKAVVERETVPFYGHRTGRSDTLAPHKETRLAFAQPRPPFETASDIVYSATGMLWNNGQLIENLSVKPVRLKDAFAHPPASCGQIDRCAVVQCDPVYSYGDWVHCYLGTILSAAFPDVPVLIPDYLARKSYVQRDLKRAKVNWSPVRDWIKINEAFVLRKPNPTFYWSAREVTAFRAAFDVTAPEPDPASLTYFGRFDLKGETIARPFPSQEAAQYVQRIGGKVVEQSSLTTGSAHEYGRDVETIIADHGSGLLNMMFWQPKTVIELVVGDWWVNNNLFVAAAMGVKNFAVLHVDGLSSDQIGQMVRECQAYFATQSGRPP